MKNTIKIPAKVIRGAMLCQATNDIREYLNGVAFNGDIGEIVSTNGHLLFVAKVEKLKGLFEGVKILQIPQKIPSAIQFIAFDYQSNRLLFMEQQHQENRVALMPNGVVLDCKELDGIYPDYQQVIPDSNEELVIGEKTLNGKYIAKAVKALEPHTNDGLIYSVYENKVVIKNNKGIKVIIMVMGGGNDDE